MRYSKEMETMSMSGNFPAFGNYPSVPTSSINSKDIESTLDADFDMDVAGMGKEFSSVLLTHVCELSNRVFDVQKLLDKVLYVLVTLNDCDNSEKLLDLWSQLCIRFSKLDLRTKEVATSGAHTIEDFLDNVCTFLEFPGTSTSAKIEGLARYREIVMNMRDHIESESLHYELHGLSDDFILFEREWCEFEQLQSQQSLALKTLIIEMQSNLREMKKLFLNLLAQTALDVGVGSILIASGIATHNVLQIIMTSLPIAKGLCCDAIRTCRAFKDIRCLRKRVRTAINHRNEGQENIINGQNALKRCGMHLVSLRLSLDIFPRFWSAMIADLDTLQTLLKTVQDAKDEIEFNFQIHATVAFYKPVQEAFYQYGRGMDSFDA